MAKEQLILNEKDNVAVLLSDGHKVALRNIAKGKPVIKFGQVIGIATKSISSGERVHVNNIKFSDKIHFAKERFPNAKPKKNASLPSSFKGYLRPDGRAGTRNFVIVMSTVNCSATVVKEVARHFEDKDFSGSGIDGVIPVTHSSGCAQALGGASDAMLNRTLAGWLYHPNVVGAVVIGLGCEDISLKSIDSSLKGSRDKKPISYFNVQDVGGTEGAIQSGIDKVNNILDELPRFARVPLPVSLLNVATNCGGSDSFSAIGANPALGMAGDSLVSFGGTLVLGETPECFGAEGYLSSRCKSGKDAAKLLKIFSWWNDYAKKHNFTINNNLAPGNIEGGISTILEKSLGAIAKGGSSPISEVANYAERITKKGLVFMDTPGFDPISVTGMVAGGCNMVAFTTGRGSVYGCSIAPTIKISTNTKLYEKMRGDIDLDAGVIVAGADIAKVGDEIYELLIDVASGKKTLSEGQGLGREEFAPWQLGENL